MDYKQLKSDKYIRNWLSGIGAKEDHCSKIRKNQCHLKRLETKINFKRSEFPQKLNSHWTIFISICLNESAFPKERRLVYSNSDEIL